MEETNNLEQSEREKLIQEKQDLLARLEVIDQYLGMPAYSDFDVFKGEILLKEMEIRRKMEELALREEQIQIDLEKNKIDFEQRSADIQKQQEGLDGLLKESRDDLDEQ